MNSILEELKQWQSEGGGAIEHGMLCCSLPSDCSSAPQEQRNFTQALKYVGQHAKNVTHPIEICWQTGVLKHGTTVIFGCDDEGGKAYYRPLLCLDITKESVEKALEWQTPARGQRL